MLDQKFILEKCIGKGGSSRVYLANDPHTDTAYAIKVIRKDKQFSYERGSQIIKEEHERLSVLAGHPNVLQSYGCNPDGRLVADLGPTDIMYNVLEFAENSTLSSFVRQSGGLGEALVKFPFMQMCYALSYIHSKGIAHMDVKLDNILLDKYYNVKVADLGVAVEVSGTNGMCDSRRGTKFYMAPEVDHLLPTETFDAYKADIYSLGMCLYVMLFGKFPVVEESEDSTFVDTETIGGITGLKCSIDCKKKWEQTSSDLQELIGSMLSMEPEDRPTLQQILESDWIREAYDEDMPLWVYEQMEQRKENILAKQRPNSEE